jgi:hypothetical protein
VAAAQLAACVARRAAVRIEAVKLAELSYADLGISLCRLAAAADWHQRFIALRPAEETRLEPVPLATAEQVTCPIGVLGFAPFQFEHQACRAHAEARPASHSFEVRLFLLVAIHVIYCPRSLVRRKAKLLSGRLAVNATRRLVAARHNYSLTVTRLLFAGAREGSRFWKRKFKSKFKFKF